MGKVFINKKGTDRLQNGHPWVFKSDIIEVIDAVPGDVVQVYSFKKRLLGQAFYNPQSLITLRFLTHQTAPIDRQFWQKRLEQSISRRPKESMVVRLVFGESDLLPGLIIDRYGDVVVFQSLSLGIDRLKEDWVGMIEELLHPAAIVERNDPSVREREGLPRQKGIVRGGFVPPVEAAFGEKVCLVDPLEGQKTGTYLDQAQNQLAARRYAHGRLLDLFCYQGGFSVQLSDCIEEGIAVDSSAPALAMARKNLERNNLQNIELKEANVFDELRRLERSQEKFDTLVLDPPPFASGKDKLEGGRRGYKEINLRAMKLLRPGGILITCSCSQSFTELYFSQMLREAAQDTGCQLQLLERRGASPDHPVLLTFPESFYLQCWIVRVI